MNDFDEFDDFGDNDEEVDTRSNYDDFESNDEKKPSTMKIIIIAIIVFLILLIIWGIYSSGKKKSTTTEDPADTIILQESVVFELNGDEKITLVVGETFVDPGYSAESSTNGSLNSFVEINGGVDTNVVGVYEITYTLIYDGTARELVRTIEVVQDENSSNSNNSSEENNNNNTTVDTSEVNISLNGASSIYIFKGVSYQDPGASATNKDGVDISGNIVISGNVDTSNTGTYTLTYSITNSSNQTKSVSRQVYVLDMSAEITPSTIYYTNEDVTLTINVSADRFGYIILPDGQKVTQSTYSYKVSSNQSYSFEVHNEVGLVKKYTFPVKNIDKEVPTGSCTITHGSSGSQISISANDNIGISAYAYNDKMYKSSTLTFGGYFKEGLTVSVGFYDKAGNYGTASCVSPAR